MAHRTSLSVKCRTGLVPARSSSAATHQVCFHPTGPFPPDSVTVLPVVSFHIPQRCTYVRVPMSPGHLIDPAGGRYPGRFEFVRF
jgi:hypothetical protein